jgi:hypothetical protein
MNMVSSALGALVMLWGIVFQGLPGLEWLLVVVIGGFAIAFAVLLAKMRTA